MQIAQPRILASALLEGEFDEFNNNPKMYTMTLGWSVKDKFKSVDKLAGKLAPTAQDVDNLTSIISSIDCEVASDVYESNTVNDFLNNCVAQHIVDNYK